MAKKTIPQHQPTDVHSIPMVNEGNQPLADSGESCSGEIRINHSVVANIVRLAASEVPGVYSVGTGIVDGITELFSKKDGDRGVRVGQNEMGHYEIEVKVILRFGVELAKIATSIQENVRKQVARMTMNEVSRVDVVIDGVKMEEARSSKNAKADADA